MKKHTILIVEDEGIIADDIADSLNILGYEVIGVESTGLGAIESAKLHKPDIVLMDIVLQGEMNGIEAARVIRQSFGIPVIFLTAYATESILESISSIDPFGYMIKPFENRELHFTIQMALFKKRTETELKRVNSTLKTLSECSKALVLAKEELPLMDELCRLLVQNSAYSVAWVCLVENCAARPIASAGNDNGYLASLSTSIDEKFGPTAAVIRSGMPLATHEWDAEGQAVIGRFGFKSALALPIVVERTTVGALTLLSDDAERFEQVEFDLLVELSTNLSHWLSSIRSRKAQVKAEAAKDVINAVSQLMLESDNLLEIYSQIPQILADRLHLPMFTLKLYATASDDGRTEARYDYGGRQLTTTLAGLDLNSQTVVIDKLQQHDFEGLDELRSLGASAYISVPVQTKNATYGLMVAADTVQNELQHKSVTMQVIANQLAQQIERKIDERALTLSHERFAAVMDSIDAAVYVSDMDTHEMLFANRHLREQFGENILGIKCWQVLHKDMQGPCDFCTNSRIIDQDGNPSGVYRWELLSSQTNRWLDIRDRAIRWVDGRLVRLEIATDITELKQAQEELQLHRERLTSLVEARTAELIEANRSLQREMLERKRAEDELLKTQKLESMAILAGGIAHDFNNFLTSILSSITLAKLSTDPSSDIHRRLTVAEKASLRARDLTQQLLTFSKSGSPVKKTTSIADLIKDSAEFATTGSSVRCVQDIDARLSHVEIDEGQISQVINNLIINASQAMPIGGTITIKAENTTISEGDIPMLKAGRYVRVSIADQGVGIATRHMTHIFDPYFTTKPGGTGLGLASTYSIIKKHDGYISANSVEGQGATFVFYLPATDAVAPSTHDIPSGVHAGSGRLLVMDDDAGIRESLGEALGFLGYEVSFAADGETAIELYGKALKDARAYEAVIMDLTIPGGMGGIEAIRLLRELDPEIKAIVSSGYSNDPVMSNYKEYGFKGVISKPYKIEDLSRIIHQTVSLELTSQ